MICTSDANRQILCWWEARGSCSESISGTTLFPVLLPFLSLHLMKKKDRRKSSFSSSKLATIFSLKEGEIFKIMKCYTCARFADCHKMSNWLRLYFLRLLLIPAPVNSASKSCACTSSSCFTARWKSSASPPPAPAVHAIRILRVATRVEHNSDARFHALLAQPLLSFCKLFHNCVSRICITTATVRSWCWGTEERSGSWEQLPARVGPESRSRVVPRTTASCPFRWLFAVYSFPRPSLLLVNNNEYSSPSPLFFGLCLVSCFVCYDGSDWIGATHTQTDRQTDLLFFFYLHSF